MGDRLFLDAIPLSKLRCGDVVVYHRKTDLGIQEEIAHRVVEIKPGGVVVQGDKNAMPDQALVTETNYVGRVSFILRASKLIIVKGGFWVDLQYSVKRKIRATCRLLFFLVRHPGKKVYAWFRKTGLVAKLWRPSMKKVQLRTNNGPLIKYIIYNRTVARYWPEENLFKCIKPYDLLFYRKKANEVFPLYNLNTEDSR